MSTTGADKQVQLDRFYKAMAEENLEGLWVVAPWLLTKEPASEAKPFLWKWDAVLRLTNEAGRLVPLERGGERRAVAMVNPGLPGKVAATDTLYIAIQLIHPGELAPPHRHTSSAIRFIVQGEGATTTVEGEKITMREGDLILTPPGTWHEHRNEGTEDVYWLDGLDIPLIRSLSAVFFEGYPEDELPLTKPVDYTDKAFSQGALRPVGYRNEAPGDNSLLLYRWPGVSDALHRMSAVEASPYDGVAVEYVNPHTGGHTLPTLACWMQMLRPEEHTQAHRHSFSVAYQVFRGSGHTIINGQRFDWSQGDCFVIPPWAWHEHANISKEEAYLFSFNDIPVMEVFGLSREQALESGHQEVTSVFGA